MKKLGVVITDGVGFRNFILSDFLQEATSTFDEVVILSCLPKEVYTDFSLQAKIIELPVFEESYFTWFFRKAKEVAHLQLHQKNNFGIQDSLKINTSTAKTTRGYGTRLIYFFTSFFHTENWIQRYNLWQQWTFKRDSVTHYYSQLLQEEQFDLLFFTHQRPPYIAPLVYAAEKVTTKTAAFIFSWDNLASKGRMAANFDYYLVWSDLMQNELRHFYSKVALEHIAVVGTPQFEPYVLPRYESSKADFYKKFELDSNLKTICFSCGDSSTSRNDELYISTLANALLLHQLPAVNLLIRTSPAEDPIRFEALAKQYPFLKWNYPKWNLSRQGHQEAWSQRLPSVDDLCDLRSILAYSDLNINMLSTMSLDFMQFDKPVINTVFGNPSNGLYDDQRFLNYAHIATVVASHATAIAKDAEALLEQVLSYLAAPSKDALHRKALLDLQVSKPLEGTGKRIATTLYQWA